MNDERQIQAHRARAWALLDAVGVAQRQRDLARTREYRAEVDHTVERSPETAARLRRARSEREQREADAARLWHAWMDAARAAGYIRVFPDETARQQPAA